MWILFALTSAIILASRKIQEKKLVGEIGGTMGWMIRIGSVVVALLLWLIFSRSFLGIDSPRVWWVLLYCVFAYPLLIVLYYKAMEYMPFSVFGMLAPIVPLTSLVGTWLVFDLVPTVFGFMGILCIAIALIVLFWKQKSESVSPLSLLSAIGAYVIMGIGSILDKVAMQDISPELYVLLNQSVALLVLFISSFFIFSGPQISYYKKNCKILSIAGVIQGIGYFLVMSAIAVAPNPGYVVALSNTHALITALYGVFVLKEPLTSRKVFVFLCMLLALISFAFA